jgi:hypothetical protein
MIDKFLMFMAEIEQAGGLVNVKSTDGDTPQLKLVCDKQTYDIITADLMGLINPVSDTKSKGCAWTIEIGELN